MSADDSPLGLHVRYRISNRNDKAIYVISSDPKASLSGWLKVPFVIVNAEDHMIEIESYIASPNSEPVEALYYHPVVKIDPGVSVEDFFLKKQIYTNLPYGQDKPKPVNVDYFDKLQLRLGYFSCGQIETIWQRIGDSQYHYVSGAMVVSCNGRTSNLFQLQSFVEDKKKLSFQR